MNWGVFILSFVSLIAIASCTGKNRRGRTEISFEPKEKNEFLSDAASFKKTKRRYRLRTEDSDEESFEPIRKKYRSRNKDRTDGLYTVRTRRPQVKSEDLKEIKKNRNATVVKDWNLKADSFGEWTDWTKCNKHCYMSRFRKCVDTTICGTSLQEHYMFCHNTKCKKRLRMLLNNLGDGHKTSGKNAKELKKLEPLLYENWSAWEPCGESCFTKRTKICRFPAFCGERSIKEDYKACYVEGDLCEKKYLESATLPNNTLSVDYEPDDLNPLDYQTCGRTFVPVNTRISGGKPVIKGSWPWQVLLLNEDFEPFCGGVVLHERWVLTAAHCNRERLFVRAGEHDLSFVEGPEQQTAVDKIFVHPSYNPHTVDNDLMLLKVAIPFTFSKHIQPICLPDETEELPKHTRSIILGWGKRRNLKGYTPEILHQAEVPLVSTEVCSKVYQNTYISENMFCAGFENGLVDSCRGDSGGPLIHDRKDGTWAIYGVTSFGDGCGKRRKYGVYANVLNHLGWIRNVIKHVELLEGRRMVPRYLTTTEAYEASDEEELV